MIDYENHVGLFGLSGIKENSVRSKIIDLFGNFLRENRCHGSSVPVLGLDSYVLA